MTQEGPARRPQILIVNVHSTLNAGDSALLLMNMQQLKLGFKNPAFIVSANYPDEPFFHLIPAVEIIPSAFTLAGAQSGAPVPTQILRLFAAGIRAILFRWLPGREPPGLKERGWRPFFSAYRKADLVVAVSGNQLLSMGRYGWPFPLTAFPIWLAHLFNKPLYVMPQSIGPFTRRWEKIIVKFLYSHARRVFLRDEVSLDLARQIGLPANRVSFAPDPAFALEGASQPEGLEILRRYGFEPGQPAVGMTVIAPLSRALKPGLVEQYYHDLAEALDHFTARTSAHIYLFNQVTGPTPREDDRLAGRQLLALLPKTAKNVKMVDETLSPAQLKACYAWMDLMLASRLHSGIFAMGAGVPTVLIGYFTKSRGLMQSMGLEDWVLELGNANAAQILDKLNRAWDQRDSLAALVNQKVGVISASILDLGLQIGKDFYESA